MPLYPGPGQAVLLRKNRIGYFFQNEQVGAGLVSVAFQLARIDAHLTGPFGASFQLKFSGPPGIFEVDIMTADVDEDGAFNTINAWTTGSLNASNQGQIQLPNIWTRFVRGKIVALSNAVNTTLTCNH